MIGKKVKIYKTTWRKGQTLTIVGVRQRLIRVVLVLQLEDGGQFEVLPECVRYLNNKPIRQEDISAYLNRM